jgi:hypothetical protein
MISDRERMMLHLAEVYAHTRILLSQIKEGSKLSDKSLAKIEMISPCDGYHPVSQSSSPFCFSWWEARHLISLQEITYERLLCIVWRPRQEVFFTC